MIPATPVPFAIIVVAISLWLMAFVALLVIGCLVIEHHLNVRYARHMGVLDIKPRPKRRRRYRHPWPTHLIAIYWPDDEDPSEISPAVMAERDSYTKQDTQRPR